MEKYYKIKDIGYLHIQECEDGYDFTAYDKNYEEIDGGQLDNSDLNIENAAKECLELIDIEGEILEIESTEIEEKLS